MRVLLIDDEEDLRKIGRISLEAVGKFEARTAVGAAEGLAVARSWVPDLVLMDMMMPGLDGLAALGQMKADPALRAIPVVIMTAKVQRTEIESYLAAGAIGVIHKPFDPMTLPAELRRLLGGS